MEEKSVTVSEDCVEAELVHEGGEEPRQDEPRAEPVAPPAPAGFFGRIKRFLGVALLLLALGLLIIGALLTSTVIGAIVGIPLLLIGAALLAMAFKLLAGELSRGFVFRKFP
ncbi:MAG TPA: hypothetical protein PKI19_09835 [Elusimicrobiales bacterium]|nr:hypothetical protein [Elusimicrobiales bacterium]